MGRVVYVEWPIDRYKYMMHMISKFEMRKKHIVIFGGSSLITEELLKIFENECEKISIEK